MSARLNLDPASATNMCFALTYMEKSGKKKYIEPYKKGKNCSDLVRLDREFEAKKQGYTAKSYIALLDEMLPNVWEPGHTFMHDNALIHSAKEDTKWLQDNAFPPWNVHHIR
jgi:hypothetical protein